MKLRLQAMTAEFWQPIPYVFLFAMLLAVTPGYGQSQTSKSSANTSGIQPFKAQVPDSVLVDLRRRLANARWPDQIPDTNWEYGADIHTVRKLAEYWQNGYNWRAAEARINQFNQFTTEIDGQRIHFIHQRSPRADAIPLMLIHGWPGSFVEFLGIIEPLTDPKDSHQPAFHVVVPSLPGFGFLGPTTSRGWNTERMARALTILMARLGYTRYGVQGGDWGSTIARQVAFLAPTNVIGLHLNFLPVPPPNPEAITKLNEAERKHFSSFWEEGRSGFFKLQSTEPQTAAYGLTDSPIGWLAWLTVKFQDFTDNDGDFLQVVDRDTFLTNVTLYWVTNTTGSSMRIYREHQLWGGDEKLPPIHTPIAYAVFPKEVIASPDRWIARKYNVVQRTQMPKGGHFAALEQPDLLVTDIRTFFGKLGHQR